MATYLNTIRTASPTFDVHGKFVEYVAAGLTDVRQQRLFMRMAERAQINHRYSFLEPASEPDRLDAQAFYRRGQFPSTEQRMKFYKAHAMALACKALDVLFETLKPETVTHLIVTSCTGFYAPGLDLEIVRHYKMAGSVERSIVGFMGCYAAINALKLARHIVRSDAQAKVVIVNLELCTLHLQESTSMEQLLSFLIFSDGCSASLVSSDPVGIELKAFHCAVLPDSQDHITWHIGDQGFDMLLSGKVPIALSEGLPAQMPRILGDISQNDITHWAIHPGGRSVLDAVSDALQLSPRAMEPSRRVLRDYGNMSSATIMFVLKDMLDAGHSGEGCAMAFGPGLTAETMRYRVIG